MKSSDPNNNLGAAFLATANILESVLNDELEKHGITFRQFQVLGCLDYQSELTQIELARWLRVEAPTLVRVLDRMERDGWVERKPHPDDRRKKVVHVTADAKRVWKTMTNVGNDVVSKATTGVSERQLKQVMSTMQHIRENLALLRNEPEVHSN